MTSWLHVLSAAVVALPLLLALHGCGTEQPRIEGRNPGPHSTAWDRVLRKHALRNVTSNKTAAQDNCTNPNGTAVGVTYGRGTIHGTGEAASTERTLPDFSRLYVDSHIFASVVFDGISTITITAQENILPHVVTEVKDGILTVSVDRHVCAVGFPIRVTVMLQRPLVSVLAAGSSTVTVAVNRVTDKGIVSMNAVGGSKIEAYSVASTGDVLLYADGASTIDVNKLKARAFSPGVGDANITAAGGSTISIATGTYHAHVNATNSSTVSLQGSDVQSALLLASGVGSDTLLAASLRHRWITCVVLGSLAASTLVAIRRKHRCSRQPADDVEYLAM